MKLITTAAALHYLGPGFRYKTRLALRGHLRGGKLSGDVVLFGGGDPKFGIEQCDRFRTALVARGVREVTGNIVVVDEFFTRERLPFGWSWHYLDAYYAPEIAALSFNDNVVSVTMTATKPGDLVEADLKPDTRYARLVNRMVTRNGTDSIIIYRAPEANVIYLDGALGKGRQRTIKVALRDPARYCGTYFKELLQAGNIRIGGGVVEGKDSLLVSPDPARPVEVIDSTESVPLSEIIRETNTESVNLYAEVMLKTLGARQYGRGSYAAGLAAAKEFLSRCGVDTTLVSLSDGSGLSKYTLISSADIVRVLRYCRSQPYFTALWASLAQPGKGTMVNRLNGFADSLRVKTGALDAVSCLSGYLVIEGVPCCFSLLFNNFTCSFKKINGIQEGIVLKLADYLRRGGK